MLNGWVKPETVPPTPDPDDSTTPPPDPDDNEGGKPPMKNNNLFWLIAAIVAVILAVLGYAYFDEQNDRLASQSEKIAALEEAQKAQASAPTEQTAVYSAKTVNTGDHDGWEKEETKYLQPGWVACGDVYVEGIQCYDEGGVNEDTVVINKSDVNIEVYAPYAAGEKQLDNQSSQDLVAFELDHGGDPDGQTVRIVEVINTKITQRWYKRVGGSIKEFRDPVITYR